MLMGGIRFFHLPGVFASLAGIYLCKGAQGNPGTWFWVGFDGDIFKLHDDLKAKGVKIRQAPTNYSWAMEMQVEDPDGHVLRFGTDPNYNAPFLDEPNNGNRPLQK